MSRCVPNWDLDDDDAPAAAHPRHSFLGADLPLYWVDSKVAELTWENGQLSQNGLRQPLLNSKPAATTGTLESLVNQAPFAAGKQAIPISGCEPFSACAADLIPWFKPSQAPTGVVTAASGTMMMDALVPCAAAGSDDPRRQAIWLLADSAGHGDCREWGDHQNASGSSTFSHHVTTLDTYEHERELDNATSEESPENTQSGKVSVGRDADTTTEEHDSVYSRPPREVEKRRIGNSSLSTKWSRATAIHNQSERKRRDKINQKMKTLQKLVPNSCKTDKASMLDEVIDYLKQLQAQVQLMSRMNMMWPPTMILPLALQQQFKMSMMAAPMLSLGLAGMPGILAGDMSAALGVAGRPNIPVIPHVPTFLHPFMPMASWDGTLGARFPTLASGPAPMMPDPLSAFLASQSYWNFDMQAMALDAYSRLAAMYQQQQQQQPQNPNN